MKNWDEIKPELNVALNEATLLGVEVSPQQRVAGATLAVLTLPAEGPPPEDSRVQLVFRPVGRVMASLRMGYWDDPLAEVVPFELGQLLKVVQDFGGQPIYGWDFFDVHEQEMSKWGSRLSLDWRSGNEGLAHSVRLFQESGGGQPKHLDLCLWFDELVVRRPDGSGVALEEFAAGGRRWWDGLYAGDERTDGHGIFPGGQTGRGA